MDYKNLKDAIKAVIKKNGAQEITGQIMQDTLLSIVSKLGGNKTFAGVASPTTVPDTTDANIFYIAGENGTYVNFGGAKVENEAAVFVQVSGGTWRAIYTGIQTSHGVNNQLQQEHEYFETEIDKVSADLTQFKQTEFTDVKEDVERHATEIAKNKSDITYINGEIATLNEATNTAADELVRIEGKVDANLKDAVVVFVPSTNTGVYKGADILSFTNDTPTSTVTAYMSQYWDKLVKLASGKISGSVYAESNNANCTGGSCISGTQFGYLKIEIEDYQKGGLGGEALVLSFDSGTERKEMSFTNSGSNISIYVKLAKNVSSISDLVFQKNGVETLEGVYCSSNANIQKDKNYSVLVVCIKGVSRLKLLANAYDAAKIIIVSQKLKVLRDVTHMFTEYKEKVIDLGWDIHNEAFYIIVSNYNVEQYGATPAKYEILSYKENFANQINETVGGTLEIDIALKEENAGFLKDGSIDHILLGYNRVVFPISLLDSVLARYEISEENISSLVYLSEKDSQSGIPLDAGIKKNEWREIDLSKANNPFICLTYKKDTGYSLRPYKQKASVFELLSELYAKKSSLATYGDLTSIAFRGEEMYATDEYSPSNEVQTLEEKPMYKNFAYYIAKRNKLRWSDYTYNTATLTDCKTEKNKDLQSMLVDDAIISLASSVPDYITLWFGINDAKYNPIMQREMWLKDKYKANIAYPMQESEIGKEGYATAEQKAEVDKAVGRVGEVDYDNADSYFFAKFVGTENDKELTTWCGALNYAFPLLMSEYPTAKILLIVPDHEKHGEMLRKATIKMAEKWGILYFDLNSLPYWYGSKKTKFENTQHEEMQWLLASGETAAPTVEGFNKSRYSYDGVRPSELGHKVISFPIGNKLING